MSRIPAIVHGSSRLLLAAGCTLGLLLFVGCSSTSVPQDPVERAKLVKLNTDEGLQIMEEVKQESIAQSRNPNRDIDAMIDKMLRARAAFERATLLVPDASKARYFLASCNQLIGFEYLYEHGRVAQQLAELESRGQSDPQLKARVDELWGNVNEYLNAANQDLHFYGRFIYPTQPKPEIYDLLRINYEIQRDWENAISASKMFLNEVNLKEDQRKGYERYIRLYEERMLDDVDENL